MNTLLEYVAGPVLRFLIRAAGNYPTGGVVPLGDWVIDIWESYSRKCSEAQLRADLEKVAQDHKAFRAQVEVWLTKHASKQPEAVRRQAANYLNQMPGQIQRSLQRPEDPSGRTVPLSLRLQKPEDLKQFLPARLPRFQAGDRPFVGSDLIVQELVGTGGFGEVWRAVHEHRPNAAPVALKFCTDEQAARSLLREVDLLDRVVSKGRHPGIVELKYAHLGSKPVCLEYEYVEGGDLAQLINELHARNQMTPGRAGRLLLQLARAVGFAHRQTPPIVHRDLKPGNVLVRRTPKGQVQLKVADFGIGSIASEQIIAEWSKVTPSAASNPTTRSACTPLYASPQQRKAGPPDPRDDVYALGVIWYQMLTGDVTREPPRGGSWRKKFAEQGMPQPMIELLEQCLEDEGDDRPATAQVLADRLAELFFGGGGEGPGDPPPPEPPKKGSSASTLTKGVIHGVVTALIGFILMFAIREGNGIPDREAAVVIPFVLLVASSLVALFQAPWLWRWRLLGAVVAFLVSGCLIANYDRQITTTGMGLAVCLGIGLVCGFLRVWVRRRTWLATPAAVLGVLLLLVPVFSRPTPTTYPSYRGKDDWKKDSKEVAPPYLNGKKGEAK